MCVALRLQLASENPRASDGSNIEVLAEMAFQFDGRRTRSAIYRLCQLGQFPRPIALGPRASAWPSDEVDGWIAARIAASRRIAAALEGSTQ
jgi:hypothetical protein